MNLRLHFSAHFLWLGILSAGSLAGCQRASYTFLPASPGPYYQPTASRAAAGSAVAAIAEAPEASAVVSTIESPQVPLPKKRALGRAGAPAFHALATERLLKVTHVVAKHQSRRPAPHDGFEKPRAKGLFWKFFIWGIFLTAIGIGVVGVVTASAATPGGTVALVLLKEFLTAIPIVAAASATLSLIIRSIWPATD